MYQSHGVCDDGSSGTANHDVVCSAAYLVLILVLFLKTARLNVVSTVQYAIFWNKK